MAINYLKVGYNFTSDLKDYIINKNSTSDKNIISEVYGSRAESSLLSARPKFRIPDISRNEFKMHVKQLKEVGINFNYTMNANHIGSKQYILQHRNRIKDYIKFLIDCEVKVITVAIPLMAEYIRSVSTNIDIEVSTIAHLDTVTQTKIWKDYYGINKICGNLYKNREIQFLKNLAQYCNDNQIILTLMANEFCGNGLNETNATNCIFRDHCYSLHSSDYNADEKLDGDYPMGYCINSRNSGSVWLKMNFIRPEDMKLYNTIGINHFKITGRTATTKFAIRVIEAYLQEYYFGNLLDLWKHLETINSGNDADYTPLCSIPNDKLDGFVKFWFDNPSHICANEICGETCKHCDNYYTSKFNNSKILTKEKIS
jgi:collagenase-like PrtC family protease